MGYFLLALLVGGIAYVVASVRQVDFPKFLIVRRFGEFCGIKPAGLRLLWGGIFTGEEREQLIRQVDKVEHKNARTRDNVLVAQLDCSFEWRFPADTQNVLDADAMKYLEVERIGGAEGVETKLINLLREVIVKKVLEHVSVQTLLEIDPATNKLRPDARKRLTDALDEAIMGNSLNPESFCGKAYANFGVQITNFNLEALEFEKAVEDALRLPVDFELRAQAQSREQELLIKERETEKKRGQREAEYLREIGKGEAARYRAIQKVKTAQLERRVNMLQGKDVSAAIGAAAIEVAEALAKDIVGQQIKKKKDN